VVSQCAVLQTIGFITRFDDVTVVRQSIQQHSGHFRVTKNPRPFRKAQIGYDDHAGVLLELG